MPRVIKGITVKNVEAEEKGAFKGPQIPKLQAKPIDLEACANAFPPELSDDDVHTVLRNSAWMQQEKSAIDSEIAAERMKFEQQLSLKYGEKMKRVAVLEKAIEAMLASFNRWTAHQYFHQARTYIYHGSVHPRKMFKPGEYDPTKLREWATGMAAAHVVSKKSMEAAVRILMEMERTDLLDFDEKSAVGIATKATADGRPIFPDSPVPILTVCTQTSADRFSKLLTTAMIEEEFDARNGSHAEE